MTGRPHVPACPHLQCAYACAPARGPHGDVGTQSTEPRNDSTRVGTWREHVGTIEQRSGTHPVEDPASTPNPMHCQPPASDSTASRQEHHLPDIAPRRGRTPARRFLAPSSDAIYSSTPARRLESTSLADPDVVVELVAAAVSLRDEPECVSDAILATYGKDALYFQSVRHARTVEAARETRQGAPHPLRVRDAGDRARRQHRTDLRGELLALGKALDRATRAHALRVVTDVDGFTRSEDRPVRLPAAALERLERVEALLDRAPDIWRAAA